MTSPSHESGNTSVIDTLPSMPASASSPSPSKSEPSSRTTLTTNRSRGSRSSRGSRGSRHRRRVDLEKATAAWSMYVDRTLGAKLTIEHLMELEEVFKNHGHFEKHQLKKALEDLNIRLEEDIFDLTFLKMDTTLTDDISWDEFISHLLIELLETQEIGGRQEDMLQLPISSTPEVFPGRHRHPIIRMTFMPEVNRDRSVNYLYGKFVSGSKDGAIQFWTMGMNYDRTVYSGSHLLTVRPTWVTDFACMPDINIIATSSTERELRFYDTTANKWDLRVVIWAVDKPVVKMHYHFSQNIAEESCLILGDSGGNIRILLFNSTRKGPFRQEIGRNVVQVRYADLLKGGGLPGLRVVEFLNVHRGWIRQVHYYAKSNCFLSCASCSTTSVFMCDVNGTKSQYRYDVPSGVTCFCVAEESPTLVTGGTDCNVRVWNVYLPDKPSFVLIGHQATIVAIMLQSRGRRVYSLDLSRCVRVWDWHSQTCIQTYSKIMAPAERHMLCAYYHPLSRAWMVASMDVTVLHCYPKLNDDRTDGFTHTKPVTVVLYNSLFRLIITMGADSAIMVWDPWRGRRTLLVRRSHSTLVYGREEGVEITAACLDPPQQLLLTGARNGTLRVWNFNTGTCVRNMTLGQQVEVTSVMWVPSRILATSWTKVISEWADTGASLYGKNWEMRHTGDILCAAVKIPDCLATASANGELILWRLETGQPYARYNVSRPTHKSGMMHHMDESSSAKDYLKIALPRNIGELMSIHAMQFIMGRTPSRGVGSLFVSLKTGRVQVWSHHQVGGYLTDFLAIHSIGDYVTCMTVDPECNYLFTGHAVGYIKVWLISNYCYPGGGGGPSAPSISRPALRKEFPFLNSDVILGRAKRAVRNQPLPLLLSSLRCHFQPVSTLQYLPANKIVVSGSADHTVRLWTLSGEYIGTLGSFRPWINLRPNVLWDTSAAPIIPADLKRNSSFTSIKVLNRGYIDWKQLLPKAGEVATTTTTTGTGVYKELSHGTQEFLRGTYGQRLYKPILGRCFKLPYKALPKLQKNIALDTSMPKVQVYNHVSVSLDECEMKKPPTPPVIAQRMGVGYRLDSTRKRMRADHKVSPETETADSPSESLEKSAPVVEKDEDETPAEGRGVRMEQAEKSLATTEAVDLPSQSDNFRLAMASDFTKNTKSEPNLNLNRSSGATATATLSAAKIKSQEAVDDKTSCASSSAVPQSGDSTAT